MNTTFLIIGSLFLSGFIVVVAISWIIDLKTKKLLSPENDLHAVVILKSGIWLSFALLFSEVVRSFWVTHSILPSVYPQESLWQQYLSFYALNMAFCILTLMVIFVSVFVIINVVHRDSLFFIEIANNNIPYAITVLILLLTISFIAKQLLGFGLDILVPYPERGFY